MSYQDFTCFVGMETHKMHSRVLGVSSHRAHQTRGRYVSATSGFAAARPPILLLIGSNFVRSGLAGQAKPNRLLHTPLIPHSTTTMEAYRLFCPVINDALEMLESVQNLQERRVIVCFETGVVWPRSHEEAIKSILLEDTNVRACAFKSALELIHLAVPPKTALLVVLVTVGEVHCVICSDASCLKFTYQCCPDKPSQGDDTSFKHNRAALCILHCLQACPRSSRREAAMNIVFAGCISKDTSGNIAEIVRQLLSGSNCLDDITGSAVKSPLIVNELKSLMENISVIEPENLGLDFLPWLGLSIWAHHWHRLNSESKQIGWIK